MTKKTQVTAISKDAWFETDRIKGVVKTPSISDNTLSIYLGDGTWHKEVYESAASRDQRYAMILKEKKGEK